MKFKTGIFWVIAGDVICDVQMQSVNNINERCGFVDYSGKHALTWGFLCSKQYPDDDFSTYPRGRVMYSLKEKRYVVYADKCITDKEKMLIVEKFGIVEEPYIFATDTHYRCDKCLKRESEIFAVNVDEGVSVCRVLDGEVIETDFFERNELQAFTEYCSAYGAYDEHTGKFYLKFYDSNSITSLFFNKDGKKKYIYQQAEGNIFWYMLHKSGYIVGSRDNTFSAIANYYKISDELNAENVAKCYYKLKNKAFLSEKEATAVLNDSKYLIEHIMENFHYGSRLGDNIIWLYNYSFRDELGLSEQSIFNLIVDYLEEYKLTDIANYHISWAIAKAKQAISDSEVFDNPAAYEFRKYLETKYLYRLRATVLRGENELSGNIIKIENGYNNIIVECGKSLTNETGELEEVEKNLLSEKCSAVIVTHNHIDHIGLVETFSKTKKIYMGKLTKKLAQLQYKNILEKNIITYEDGVPFYIGTTYKYSVKVTPFLCDHSEPDSYMLLFEYDDKRILYTGDFRAHGRKNYYNLLSRLPNKVETLICEGTNVDGGKKIISEVAVQNKLSKLIKETDKPVFIFTPTENIDRIVSAYKSAVNNSRIFIVDDSEARKLEIIGGGVPHPTTFSKVFVCYPHGVKENTDNYIDFKSQSLGYKEIAKRNDYVMLIKSSSIGYITKLAEQRTDGLNDATLVYSLWSGYKESERMKEFLIKIEALGIKIITIHTSGHADIDAINELKQAVNPSYVINVHKPKI